MKSKIQFDLDDQQKPVIVASISHTDDIRDKVAYNCIRKMNSYPEDNGNLLNSHIGVAVIKYKSEGQKVKEQFDFINYSIEPLCDFGDLDGYQLVDLRTHLTQALNKVQQLIMGIPQDKGTKIHDPK